MASELGQARVNCESYRLTFVSGGLNATVPSCSHAMDDWGSADVALDWILDRSR